MDLQYFPMDSQLCYIEIESCKYYRQIGIQIDRYIDRQIDRQVDRQIDRQIDGKKGGWMDLQYVPMNSQLCYIEIESIIDR